MSVEIPGYLIIAELHRSPLTRVFRARHRKLERQVLIKVLREEFCSDPEITARFLREAQTCARLEHENVVKIYDYGEQHGVPYLVLEFVEGKDLKQLLEEQGALPLDEAVRLFTDLLRGLEHAHRLGILHRDIKPANLLVSINGTLKISDFGLATFADAQEVTQTGAIVGTPAYMAPEQVKGERLTERTDLYAAGVVFYEMLTGVQPFRGATLPETVNRVLNEVVDPPERLRPEVPSHLSELCLQLLAKDPARRPQSARVVLDRLHRKQPPKKEEAQKESSRKRRRVFPVYILGAALLVAAVVFWFFTGKDNSIPERKGLSSNMSPSDDPSKAGTVASSETEKRSPVPADPGLKEGQRQREIASSSGKVDTPDAGAKPVHNVTRLPERSEKNAQPRPSESLAMARLRVDCLPWAKVIVDGQEMGTTPFDSALRLPPGRHTLRLVNPRFPEYAETLELPPGEEITFSVNLMQEFGGVFVLVQPWADVYLDGKRVETTPMKEPIWLEPGLHTLQLVNPAFPPRNIPIQIRKGRVDTLRIQFK